MKVVSKNLGKLSVFTGKSRYRTIASSNALQRSASLSFLLAASFYFVSPALAQFPPPTRRDLFKADTKEDKSRRDDEVSKLVRPEATPSNDLDVKAPQVEFLKDSNEVDAKGGVLLSQGGTQIQGDSARINMDTKLGKIDGNVVMTGPDGVVSADSADINIDNETGLFRQAEFTLEQGGYSVEAEKANKISEFEFQVENSSMSTCHCMDDSRPWHLDSGTCNITQEGYAHCYDTSIYFQGLPILYTPWIAFPVKLERASGLLVPEYGLSSQNGFKYKQPLFLALDDSTDLTLTPFIETRSRAGMSGTYRQVFSTDSSVESRLTYSNESRRGTNLQGVKTSDIFDPQIDTNRFGGFYQQRWKPDPDEFLPVEFLADGHYISDRLFLREMDDDQIGAYNAQYLTSTAVLRGVIGSKVIAETRAEYNQIFTKDQDVVFQRAPEFSVSGRETFRPFGFNPYGVKLNLGANLLATDFVRHEGYDGWRTTVRPQASVPFHIQNYVRGQFGAELRYNQYYLNDVNNPDKLPTDPDAELDDSQSKALPLFRYSMTTGVERIYELEQGNWFSNLVQRGADNNKYELVRLKHTIEPTVEYSYVPKTAQESLPLFDSTLDRLNERSLFTYGVRNRLYGRYLTPLSKTREIGELAPSTENLPRLDISQAVQQFGTGATVTVPQNVGTRTGEIRELASFGVRQSYNYTVDTTQVAECRANETADQCASRQSVEANQKAFTDVLFDAVVSPSSYVAFQFDTNYNFQESDASSYGVSVGVRDDRDDLIRARYSYINPNAFSTGVSQIEGNLELSVTDRVRLGYYGRYDDVEGEFLENKALVRYIADCRCWSVDVGVSDRENPDRKQFLVSFSLAGLGNLTQNIGYFTQTDDTAATP